MAALKMGVYTPGLELVGLLESFKSLIFQEQAFAAGSFTVDCSMTPTVRRLLVKENIIWFQEETAGIIEYIFQRQDEAGPYITAKGRLLSGILDRRILWGRYDMSGTPQSIMCRMVDACAVTPTDPARVIPGLTIEPPAEGGPNIRKQKTGGTLLETLSELGETYNVAFGVRLDPGGPEMVFWTRPGLDRTMSQSENDPVFFSTELDDVLESEYTYDSSGYRNVTLVAGEGEGEGRVMVTVNGELTENEDDAARIGQARVGEARIS